MGIPPLLLQEAQFTGWMTCLLQAVQRPVPKVNPSPDNLCTSPASAVALEIKMERLGVLEKPADEIVEQACQLLEQRRSWTMVI